MAQKRKEGDELAELARGGKESGKVAVELPKYVIDATVLNARKDFDFVARAIQRKTGEKVADVSGVVKITAASADTLVLTRKDGSELVYTDSGDKITFADMRKGTIRSFEV